MVLRAISGLLQPVFHCFIIHVHDTPPARAEHCSADLERVFLNTQTTLRQHYHARLRGRLQHPRNVADDPECGDCVWLSLYHWSASPSPTLGLFTKLVLPVAAMTTRQGI